MSYSNNWDISGITGLTNLKDCYQWNGEKRLYTVGMLRNKNTNKNDSAVFPFSKKVPIRIDDNEIAYGPSVNKGTLRYMGIPRYYIKGNTLYGISVDDQYQEDNNFRYTNVNLQFKREESKMPTFGFLQYPTIIPFLDSFSDWTIDQISPSDVAISGNVYYDQTNVPAKWVIKTEEPADKSKFFIASYYHKQLPMNDPSTDIYHIWWSEGNTDIYNSEMDFHNDITLKLYGNGNPTSLSLVNANGVTGSAQERRYLDALFFSNTISLSCTTEYTISWKDTIEPEYKGQFVAACPFENVVNVGNINCSFEELGVYLPYYLNSVKHTLTPGTFYCSITYNVPSLAANQWFCFEPHYSVKGIRMNGSQRIGLTPWQGSNLNQFEFYVGDDTDPEATHYYANDGRFIYHLWRYRNDNVFVNWSSSSFPTTWYPFLDNHLTQGEHGTESESYNWVHVETSALTQYTCPFVLSTDPALSFERSMDSRNNNSYCYKVYYGVEAATVNNTGGSIQVYVYISNTPELITLTLNNDSDTTYETLSNGGKIYWDGITHGQVTDGCIVYEQPGATWGSWEGFGPNVTLHPLGTTVEYFENPGIVQRWKYFSGWEIHGRYIYGNLTTVYTQDGSTTMKVDTNTTQSYTTIEHSFTTGTMIDWNQHPVNILYSRLEWGYDPNNLTYVAEYSDTQLIPVTKVDSSESTYNPEGYENYAPYYELTGTVPSTITVLLTIPTEFRGVHTATISGRYTTIASYSDTVEGVHITEELIYDSDTQRIFCTYHHQDETDDEYGYSDLTVMAVFAAAI